MRSKLVLLVIFIVTNIGIQAQIRPKHENKVYRAPNGRLYVQKSMPVYVRLATSPADGAETYLLQSEATKKYANPMYFDLDGYNTLRSPSQVDTITKKPVTPKQDIIFEVYADGIAPVSTHRFDNTGLYKMKGKTYISGTANLTLAATDEVSGVENIYYSIDSADYMVYTAPIRLETEKEYIIKYYAVDHVGNAEKEKRMVLVTDFSKPKTTYSIHGDNFENTLSGKALINIAATDANGSGIAKIIYKMDDGNDRTYTLPINAANLEQGEHKLTFYATDQVNNRSEDNVFEFYVDKTPPTVMQEITGKSYVANGREFSSGRSQLQITTIDNKAGIKEIFYSINNGAYKRYEKPVTLANTSGTLSVKSYAVDNVNNIGYNSDSGDQGNAKMPSYVDLGGPAVSHNFTGPVFKYHDSVYISSKTKIILTASDKESGTNHIEYSINAGESVTYSAAFIVPDEGLKNIQYTGFDNVDNTTPGKILVTVDNTGPEIFNRFSVPPFAIENNTEIYPLFVTLFFAVTDKQTGFERMVYSLNGQPEKTFTGFISSFVKGNNRILVKAFDKLGNRSEKTVEFIAQ
jgi:hypothetical protein